MLACVCRPMSGNLPKMPPNVIPTQKLRTSSSVITAEPKIKVPGRLTSAELRAMALRQQQQIDSQHQLLATKEQRLRFLKSQEVRNAVANAEGERLRRLRERVEAQESKLRRLRALRGQVDVQKTYNVTLSNDLDSIRALFSEKEKELSLAVAKVEALTRQLEDLRRDRRCSINLIGGGNGNAQPFPPQSSRELEKLRRELMYRNQLSLQQDARLHLQREALQQRQAELRSVDQRIFELQNRLQRKRAANVQTVAQNQNHQLLLQQHILQHAQQQQQQSEQEQESPFSAEAGFQAHIAQQGVVALKQQLFQNQSNHAVGVSENQQALGRSHAKKFSNNPNRSIRGNIAAVEPYIHTPQKSAIPGSAAGYIGAGGMQKHAAATANTNQQNKLIQDLTHVKLSLAHNNSSHAAATQNTNSANFCSGESDESKLAKKMMTAALAGNSAEAAPAVLKQVDTAGSSSHIYAEIGPKKRDLLKEPLVSSETATSAACITATQSSRIPKPALLSKVNNAAAASQDMSLPTDNSLEQEQKSEIVVMDEKLSDKNSQQLTVHSVPLSSVNRSIAMAVSNNAATTSTTTTTAASTPRSNNSTQCQQQPSSFVTCSVEVPPRKPISSVAPTSVTSSIPKIINYNLKVNRVAPSVVTSAATNAMTAAAAANADRPALPPKPSKMSLTETSADVATAATVPSKKTPSEVPPVVGLQPGNINDNLPIKAKPLTIRKQPLSEQPRLKLNSNICKPTAPGQVARKAEAALSSALLLADGIKSTCSDANDNAHCSSPAEQQSPHDDATAALDIGVDELDRSAEAQKSPDSLKRRIRTSINANTQNSHSGGKPKLTRRVSFDPLALLLDASLEGELELVKKTAQQVTNPSAANDEGITALHNAICAGHFDIVKFLVEFGCDVNAQDSDGWTPLHCAASCNNLSMVKFLVESGACLFAATLSDHETPAEKCEEDEEGFDGCSEYLYSIQEKLGILHAGEVYAVFSYDAQNSDELTFNTNEHLIILRKGDDAESEWWWAKNSTEQEGYVPRNLLGLYPRVPPQSSNTRD